MSAHTVIAVAASTTHEIGVGVIVAVVSTILFELVRKPVMRAIRATPNLNASKPYVLLPLVVVGVFIALGLLHLIGVHVLM